MSAPQEGQSTQLTLSEGLDAEAGPTAAAEVQAFDMPTGPQQVDNHHHILTVGKLEVGPLLEWQQDEEVNEFLDALLAAGGAPAVDAFRQLLGAVQALLQPLQRRDVAAAEGPCTPAATAAAATPPAPAAAAAADTGSGANCSDAADRSAGQGKADGGDPSSDGHEGRNGGGDISCGGSDGGGGGGHGCPPAVHALSRRAASLLELCWEKLHLGYWKDVPLAWRDGYSLACVLDVTLRLRQQRHVRQQQELVRRCLRQLDLGLMMGGPLWRPHVHAMVEALQRDLAGAEAEAEQATAGVRQAEAAVADVPEPVAEAAQTTNLDVAMAAPEEGGEDGEVEGHVRRPAKRLRADVEAGGDGGSVVAAAAATTAAAAEGSDAGVRLPRGSLGGPPGSRVPVSEQPDLEEFLVSYMVPQVPVVVTGAMEHWPALSRWGDMSYLVRAAGARTVPVEVGSHYLAEGWGQQLMTLRDFLARHVTNQQPPPQQQQQQPPSPPHPQQPHAHPAAAAAESQAAGDPPPPPPPARPPAAPLGYLAQHPLFEQIPALRADLSQPDYCCLGEGEVRAVNAWLGPAGTTTPLHTDPHHNLLAQVVGRKYVRLYAPAHTAALHPFPPGSMNHNSSRVDLDADLEAEGQAEGQAGLQQTAEAETGQPGPSCNTATATAGTAGCSGGEGDGSSSSRSNGGGCRFPGVAALPYQDVVLEPGQMLYIPPGWWHFVRALTTSFSVSFWWS